MALGSVEGGADGAFGLNNTEGLGELSIEIDVTFHDQQSHVRCPSAVRPCRSSSAPIVHHVTVVRASAGSGRCRANRAASFDRPEPVVAAAEFGADDLAIEPARDPGETHRSPSRRARSTAAGVVGVIRDSEFSGRRRREGREGREERRDGWTWSHCRRGALNLIMNGRGRTGRPASSAAGARRADRPVGEEPQHGVRLAEAADDQPAVWGSAMLINRWTSGRRRRRRPD